MSNATKDHATAAPAINFIRNIIDADLSAGKHATRKWSGQPGPAAQQFAGVPDPAKIRTRFPPEPNGYLHFGHAKSICLNFGLARDYGGHCHLRFDDTNPEKEEQEYVDSIIDAVKWLGFSWEGDGETNLYYASNYFDWMVQFAEYLLASGHAYVDSQSADEMRAARGTLTEAGKDSPYRNRSVGENLELGRRNVVHQHLPSAQEPGPRHDHAGAGGAGGRVERLHLGGRLRRDGKDGRGGHAGCRDRSRRDNHSRSLLFEFQIGLLRRDKSSLLGLR